MAKKETKKGKKVSKGKKGSVSTVEARKDPTDTKKAYEKEIAKHKKGQETLEQIANQPKTIRQKLRAQYDGVMNKARFAADTVVYAVPTMVNNYRSARAVRNNPNMPIDYIVKGMANLKQHQYRKARAARRRGYAPVIVRTKHGEHDDEKKYKLFVKQIKKFHKKARIKNAKARYDIAQGHSSGGNDVIYAAHKKQTSDLGLNGGVQPAGHDYFGMEMDNLEQKAYGVVLNLKGEDVGRSEKARKIALKRMKQGRAYVDIETVAFSKDMLVPAKNCYHPHASKLHVIDHPHADHFAGSGSHEQSIEMMLDLADNQRNKNIAKHQGAQKSTSYQLKRAA